MKIKKEQCGHITIIGETNVGKSTLLNQIIEKKISITSRKKNTTQNNIIGILTKKSYQSIYIDTPGITFDCKNNIIQYSKNYFYKTIKQSVLIIFMIDKLFWTEKNEIILKKIRNNKASIILIINKIDKFKDKNILLPFIEYIKKKMFF